jgi:drug/metabolite transporter (DMT)-like permease
MGAPQGLVVAPRGARRRHYMPMSAAFSLPLAAAAMSSVLGGSSMVAMRLVIDDSDPTSIALIRCLGTAPVLGFVVFGLRGKRLPAGDALRIAALGAMMFGGFGWLMSAGLVHVPAARGALILATMPLLTLALSTALGREPASWTKAAGAGLALAGVAVALGDRELAGPDAWKGDLMLAGAAVVGAVHAVLSGTFLRRHAALPVTAIQAAAGIAVLGSVLAWSGDISGLVSFSGWQWLAVFFLAFVGGLLSFVLWFWGLERLDPSRAVLTVSLNRIAAALGGALLLAEPLTLRLLAGLIGVIAGIALASRRT